MSWRIQVAGSFGSVGSFGCSVGQAWVRQGSIGTAFFLQPWTVSSHAATGACGTVVAACAVGARPMRAPTVIVAPRTRVEMAGMAGSPEGCRAGASGWSDSLTARPVAAYANAACRSSPWRVAAIAPRARFVGVSACRPGGQDI